MDNLSYISFIAITVSLALMLPLMEKKLRRLVVFMITGIFSCLFVSELNNILLGVFQNDIFFVTTTVTPITEEIVKMLPILFFAIMVSDERSTLIPISYAVGVGFALLENVVILTQNVENVTILWAPTGTTATDRTGRSGTAPARTTGITTTSTKTIFTSTLLPTSSGLLLLW